MHAPFKPPSEIEFLGCRITVTRDALIPRVETEFLPDHAAPFIQPGMTVWDVCCGTGCIGLAVKKNFPHTRVILSDISEAACRLARYNADQNGLDVEIRCGDFLAPFEEEEVDIIFCNPPYVTESEYETIDASVRDFDPKLALVSGPTGLEFYERLARERPSNARLFLEIGTGQGPAIQEVFNGGQVLKDLAGHDRYFILEPRMSL